VWFFACGAAVFVAAIITTPPSWTTIFGLSL